MNHHLIIFLIRTLFAIISKNTKYCKDFNLKKHYSTLNYIYIPNKINSFGIVYFLSCLLFPIIIQKMINIVKKYFIYLLSFYT